MKLRGVHFVLLVLLVVEALLLAFGPQTKDHLPAIADAAASGHKTDWWDDAAMGVRYAAWINVGLLNVLLLTTKWWTRGFAGDVIQNLKSKIQNFRWFWPALIAAAALCLTLRLPLASKSLWWDEAWVIMQASHGKWTPDKKHEGQLKFTAHDWKRCAWYYQKPTNHAPMSLLQKASITTWQKLMGAKREEFSDLSARVPSLLASCLAVIFLGCLLRAWGRPGAGVAAAFLLAIHPWHIRYGVDARAYALVVPLCISGMFAVTRILEGGGRRIWPWAWWGLTEFIWLWAYPNAVLDISALNICLAILLWRQQVSKQDRWTAMFRLVATNVFAAMCFIQMFLPNLMQARHWAGQETDAHVLDWNLASTTLSQLVLGTDHWVSANSFTQISGLVTALLIICVCILQRRQDSRISRGTLVILLSLVASSLVFATATWVLHSYFYSRFVIALLPVCIAILALAIDGTRWRAIAWGVTFFGFIACSSKQMQNLRDNPIAPLSEVTQVSRCIFKDMNNGKCLVACYGHGGEVMPVYIPWILQVQNRVDLESLMQRAKREDKSLIVIYGHSGFNRTMNADGFALLDDHAVFEELKTFPGIEQEFYYHLLRMR